MLSSQYLYIYIHIYIYIDILVHMLNIHGIQQYYNIIVKSQFDNGRSRHSSSYTHQSRQEMLMQLAVSVNKN